MHLTLKRMSHIIIVFFIITQVFAFSLSFMDSVYDSGIWQQGINAVYQFRNLSFVASIFIILVYARVTIDDVLLLFGGMILYTTMFFLFSENMPYFREIQPLIKYIFVAYVSVRAKLVPFQTIKKAFVWSARIVSVLLMLTLLQNVTVLPFQIIYMEFANAISMSIALLLYSGIIDKNAPDLILSITGLVLLLTYGSRGALMTLCILAAYLVWVQYKNTKIVYVIIFLSILIVMTGPEVLSIALDWMTKAGFNSRTLEKLLSGKFLVSNDRLRIYRYLFKVLRDNFIFGVGLCGDRYYLPLRFTGVDATYAHNLILELYLDFGVIIGTIIMTIMGYLLYVCYFNEEDLERKGLFSAFFTVGFLQLMTSRSWITEQNFFIFFALLLTYSTSTRIKFVWEINKSGGVKK